MCAVFEGAKPCTKMERERERERERVNQFIILLFILLHYVGLKVEQQAIMLEAQARNCYLVLIFDICGL